jgi:hypothetical protein
MATRSCFGGGASGGGEPAERFRQVRAPNSAGTEDRMHVEEGGVGVGLGSGALLETPLVPDTCLRLVVTMKNPKTISMRGSGPPCIPGARSCI